MRLSETEKQKIHLACQEIFGKTSRVYLFGSRVDDTRLGGDIDLYVITEDSSDLARKESLFLLRLYEQIGEQKIDIVFNLDQERPIEQEALRHGVLL